MALWWMLSTLIGWVAFPVGWTFFHRLSDRGYGLSRAIGLLIAGYTLWIGASLGFLRNSLGGVLGALAILGMMGFFLARRQWEDLLSWLKENRRTIIFVEVLFLIAFGFWAFVRANNPEISGTEKPMELAFLNSILNSDAFPPKDPWLADYAISYYYFGYILMAFLARLSGVLPSVAFNLGNALWFALVVVGCYSILYNLIAATREKRGLFKPLLGPLFVVITGNLGGLLELLYYRHVFWRVGFEGQVTSKFWSWINVERWVQPPTGGPTWVPDRHWWWWQSSRVVQDFNLSGQRIEVIDEFPFFSFLLADNHPHLLALPFVLLAISFVLQVFRSKISGGYRLRASGIRSNVLKRTGIILAVLVLIYALAQGASTATLGAENASPFAAVLRGLILGGMIAGAVGVFLFILFGGVKISLPAREFWPAAWVFGSLAFLNTWDFPIYLGLLLAVILWTEWKGGGSDLLKRGVATGFALVIAGALFYLPWYPSFQSQAGGILPNLIFPTRLPHFLIMFAPIFVPILIWLLCKFREIQGQKDWRIFLYVALGLPLVLFLISLALGLLAYAAVNQDPGSWEAVMGHLGVIGEGGDVLRQVFGASISRRLTNSWTALLLGIVLGLSTVHILRNRTPESRSGRDLDQTRILVMMMIGFGALLVLGPEFLYLKDSFGTRMNTIFKFYFAAWILWGLSAAYATIMLWPKRLSWNELVRSLVILPLVLGLVYPVLSLWTKTEGFSPFAGRTLDGMAYLQNRYPEEYEAMKWIQDNLKDGVIVEAIGGSYTYYGRISAHTGLTTLLGWPGHELQWRGGYEEQGSRQGDVEKLYKTRNWREAKEIVDRYGVDYVYIGPLERSTYQPLTDRKFESFMTLIYENGPVKIYATNEAT
jgi:uncharacterized membrane protein